MPSRKVRIVCRPCRRRLVLPQVDHAPVVIRCDRCGRSYPVGATRLSRELMRALRDPSRVIELPLL